MNEKMNEGIEVNQQTDVQGGRFNPERGAIIKIFFLIWGFLESQNWKEIW